MIIGLLKKLLLSTSFANVSGSSYNSHLSDNLIDRTLESQLDSDKTSRFSGQNLSRH
jgi:hypothetical protein